MTAFSSGAFESWKAKALSVPIEAELARRGIRLRGKIERAGPCPKCGGDDRFSINTVKQVFNCRHCGVGGNVIDLVCHLDEADFKTACTTLTAEPPPNGKDKDAPKPAEVRTANYVYRDESGSALFAVARYEYQNPDGSFVLKNGKRAKTFKQRRPDPASRGSSIPNVEGVRIIPYRLPGLIEAIGNDHTILIVEGEAKADLLWSWNVPATCNAMGAGKWRSDHSAFLAGADVVIVPDNDEPGRDHADAVAASLQCIAKSVRMLELPGLEPKQDIVDWARQGGTVEQLHDLIAREAKPWIPRQKPEAQSSGAGTGAGSIQDKNPAAIADDRPALTLSAGNLHELATRAEALLIAAAVPFYSRSGEIVKPIIEDVPAFKGRRTKVARLKTVTADMLRDHLSRVVRFEKYDKREKEVVATNPPQDIAQIILARDGDWKFPRLTGIITTPTMRPDGSILASPGYDPATGLLLTSPPPMPLIPEQPSRADAISAVELLNGLLTEFPFADDASRSVALSILMTPVARGAMQCVPLHAVSAPEPGTGKSYLLDTAAVIATGEIAPVIAAGRSEEETEKRLAAELMTGQPIISIDNLNGDLSGDFICQAIERPVVKPRILGRSETRRIDNTVTFFGNGNNLRFVGDIVRRVILCSLDANLERPELRKFSGDPVATVLADRGRYIAAVLTIIRAYLAARSPEQCRQLASFADWSRFVRSPLMWLGYRDPVETMETARAEDPTRTILRAVIAAWSKIVPIGQRLTAGDLKELACSPGDDQMALNGAIAAIATVKGRSEIDSKELGKWLGRNKSRVVDRHKIHGEKDQHTKQMRWWLTEIK